MANADTIREEALRESIVHVCRLMYERGLIAATDGNVSARLDAERLIATPSGLCKGLLTVDDLVVTDMAGDLVGSPASDSGLRPSAELRLHLEIYHQRPDVNAVVHA